MFSNILPNQNQPQSSIFGAASQPQQMGGGGGGLFSNSAPQGGGGLFGSTTSQPAQGGGLFGSLLGGGSQSQNPPQNQGFFGAQQQMQPQNNSNLGGQPPQQGGGLFGSAFSGNQPSQPIGGGGGLFGNNSAQQPSSGLFGQSKPPGVGGLFGQSAPASNPQGGLFGQQPQQNLGQPGGSGLFGGLGNNNANNNAPIGVNSSGLFGNNQGSGIFGGAQPLGAQPIGGQPLGGSILGGNNNQAGGGLFQSFAGQQQPNMGIGMNNNQGFGNFGETGGTINIKYDRAATKKPNENNCFVQSINCMPAYKDKTLGELRLEDWKLIVNNKLPDEMRVLLQSGQTLVNYNPQNKSSFGGNVQNNSNMNTPIFGNQQNKPAQSAGLFNSNPSPFMSNQTAAQNQPLSGGLFNSAQNNNSIFGGLNNNIQKPATTPLGGGLMNPQPQPNNYGNLFNPGNNNNNMSSGGLFGNQPTGGLLGNQNNNSLLGGNNQNQPQAQAGSLFGNLNNSAATPTFGNNNASNSSSLFGNLTSQNNSQPNQLLSGVNPAQTSGGLFSNIQAPAQNLQNNNFGGGGLFGGQNNNSLNNTQGAIPNYQNPNSNMINPVNNFNIPIPSYDNSLSNNWVFHDWSKDYQNFYGKNYEDNTDFGISPYYPYKKFHNLNVQDTLQKTIHIKSKKNNNLNDMSLISTNKNESYQKFMNKKDFLDQETYITNSINSKNSNSYELHEMIRQKSESFTSNQKKIQQIYEPTIKLTIEILGPNSRRIPIDCEIDMKVGELKTQILKLLENMFNRSYSSEEKYYRLMYRHPRGDLMVLKEDSTLTQCNLSENDSITLIKDLNTDLMDNEDKNLARKELIPILTKQGYSLEPSIAELSRMTENELRNVKNFAIRNEYATVIFEGKTDVTELNLDKIVNFSHRCVELYPHEIYDDNRKKPKMGSKLNKEAMITFHKFNINNNGQNKEKIENKIRSWCSKNDMEFIKYDWNNLNLMTNVKHF